MRAHLGVTGSVVVSAQSQPVHLYWVADEEISQATIASGDFSSVIACDAWFIFN